MTVGIAFGLQPLSASAKRTRAPTRVLLLNDGDLKWANYNGELTEESARSIIAAFESQGVDLVIDWEHASLTVDDKGTGTAPAAGWIKALTYVPGEGLYADPIEWTEEARAAIEDEEYKYTSPVILTDKKSGALERLHSVALTNRPRTKDQKALMAAAERLAARLTVQESDMTDEKKTTTDEPKPQDKSVESAADGSAGDTDKLLLKAAMYLQTQGIDIADDATPEEIIQAFLELGSAAPVEEEAPAEEASDDADMAALKVKAAQYDKLNERVKQLEADKTAARVNALVDEQVEAGKLLPDDTKAMSAARAFAETDPDGFKVLFAAAAPIAPPGTVISGASRSHDERSRIIASAKKEYEADPANAEFAKAAHWINVELKDHNLPPLTEDEAAKL